MSKSPEEFSDRLAMLCSGELSLARKDPGRLAEMIERLVASLALTIAVGTHGEPKQMSVLLEGASQILFSEAIEKAAFARKMPL